MAKHWFPSVGRKSVPRKAAADGGRREAAARVSGILQIGGGRATPISAEKRGRAVIVAIEGGDQAGKRTQAGMLARKIKSRGMASKVISFPQYGTPTGRQIRALLLRRRAPPPQLIHCLLAANRWECLGKIERAAASCDVVVLDRYVHSNVAYGAANGLDRAWLRALDRGLPEADRVVFLDVGYGEARARKSGGRDAFESDADLARRVASEYRRMARGPRWSRIDASGSRAEVHARVAEALGL